MIIHTVGLVWAGGGRGEDDLWASCYRHYFVLAISRRIKTMAFLSIRTGAYWFPVERAAGIALRETVSALGINADLQKVVFVCFDQRTYECYRNALAEEMKRGNNERG